MTLNFHDLLPLPGGHAAHDAILLGDRVLQGFGEARGHYRAAFTHCQRPPLPDM
jgi:hypothetical protein